jgi:hypothetical protein
MNKAIVFTVFNRPKYLERSLNEWSKVRSLNEFDFYFKIEPSDVLDQNMYIIDNFKDSTDVNVLTFVNSDIRGCGKNTWEAFDEAFSKYDFVMLAEDDIHPSKDICEFFSYLEKKYRDEEEVAIISANHEFEGYSETSVSKINIFRGQIWGTWKKYWDTYIKDTWDFKYDSSVDGGPAGWDWNLSLRVLPNNNLKTVVPHSSRSQHIGVDGIHCNEVVFFDTLLKSFKDDYDWKELIEV